MRVEFLLCMAAKLQYDCGQKELQLCRSFILLFAETKMDTLSWDLLMLFLPHPMCRAALTGKRDRVGFSS